MEIMLSGKTKAPKEDMGIPTLDGVQLSVTNSVKSHRVILHPASLLEKQNNAAVKKGVLPTPLCLEEDPLP